MKVLNQNTQPAQSPMQKGSTSHRTTFILIGIAALLISLVVGVLLSRQQQPSENKASEIGPTCPLEAFRCTWKKEAGVTYSCTILEVTTTGTVVVSNPTVKDGATADEALCAFTPQANKTYRCSIQGTLFEGCATTATGDMTCSTLSPTPTATPTPTPTPTPNPKCYITLCNPQTVNHCATQGLTNHSCVDTDLTQAGTDYRCVSNPSCTTPTTADPAACWCAVPTPTVTPTPTPTPTATPTVTPTPTSVTGTPTPTTTNTPTAGVTTTPKPTDIVVVNNTATSTPIPTVVVSTTPAPTLPVAGLPQATYLIILAGIVVVALGLAL